MKILFLTPTYFPIAGGAERGIYEIARHLAHRHEIGLLTPEPDPYYYRFYGAQKEDESFFHPPLPSLSIFRFKDRYNLLRLQAKRKGGSFLPPFSLSAVKVALSLGRSLKPNVAVTFYALPTGLAGLALKKILKIPFVLSLIGRDVPGPQVPRLWKKYVRLIAHQANRIIFISQYCQQALGPIKSVPTHIIPFGVDLKKFCDQNNNLPLRSKFNLPPDAYVIFCVQRLDPWKKTEIIIEAIHHLVKTDEEIYLLIGGRGEQEKYLKTKIHQLNLEKNVFLTGFIPENEIPGYFHEADLFCFHSTYETFGLVLLQAMAAGKPIVAVRSTAIPELIEHEKTGLLVDPMNPEAMAEAIRCLIKNKNLAIKLGQQAKEKAQLFSWDFVAAQYEQVILKVASEGRLFIRE